MTTAQWLTFAAEASIALLIGYIAATVWTIHRKLRDQHMLLIAFNSILNRMADNIYNARLLPKVKGPANDDKDKN